MDAISSPYAFRQVSNNPFIHYADASAYSVKGATYHPFNLRDVKEQWVNREMTEREDQFTDYNEISIFVGTWNVNGRYACEALIPWLRAKTDPELYVLGFQELDLSAEAFLLTDTSREDEWTKAIFSGLGEERASRYKKIMSKQLVGMLLIVLARKDCVGCISEVTADSAGCGIMGMMGNKGGVAIRLRFLDSYICFVNSHLAADTNQVDRRNQDYTEICRRIGFAKTSTGVSSSASTGKDGIASGGSANVVAVPMGSGSSAMSIIPASPLTPGGVTVAANSGKTVSVFDADHLIWLGDLNYRIPLPEPEVKRMLEKGQLEALLGVEQLNIEKLAGRAFTNFEEGLITFPPTYKFDVGTSQYDSSEKRRSPSWCDRVLWKSKKRHRIVGGGIGNKKKQTEEIKAKSSERQSEKGTLGEFEQCRLIEYKSYMEMVSSDHKPVSALLRCKVKSLLPAKYLETHAQIIRELDKFENEIQPDATISMTSLDFGSVKYLVPKTRTITMENTGKVITQFRFLKFEQAGGGSFAQIDGSAKKSESDPGDGVSRPWMYISPSMGMLVPGEKIEIEISMVIDNASAEKLNIRSRNVDSGSSPTTTNAAVDDVSPRLDDTLILHLENGKDFFITIVGSFDKTCFALGLERLVRLRSPVRFDDGAGWENKDQAAAPKSVPTELWRMIDFLWKHAMEVDDLFILSGDQSTMVYIRECLDTGADFDYDRLLNDSEITNDADPSKLDNRKDREGSESSTTKSFTTPETETEVKSTPPPLPLRLPPLQLSHLSPMTSMETMPAVLPSNPASPASPSEEHLGIHSMAETLLRFLESLPEPVIPFALQPRCLEAASVLGTVGLDACKASLAFLPSTHFNVFLYVVSFLKEVVRSAKRRRRRRREESRSGSGEIASEDTMQECGPERRRRGSTTSLVPGDEAPEVFNAENATGFASQLEDTMVVKKLAVIFSSILLRPQTPPASGDRFAESAARKRRIYLTHFLEGGTDDDDDEDEEDDESEEEDT